MIKHLLKAGTLLSAVVLMFSLAQAQAPGDSAKKRMQELKRKQLGEKGFQDWLKSTRQKDLTGAPTPAPAKLSPDEEALFEAARKGDVDQAKALLDKGVSVKLKTKLGETPLGTAASFGEYEVFDLFLTKGATINDMDVVGTPLFSAAGRGDLKRINWLLERGADPNLVAAHGLAPTAIATIKGHPEAAKLLIAQGAKPDVFTCAQQGDHRQLAELLKQKPALANERSSNLSRDALTPLHLATEGGHAAAVELLLANGAEIWIQRDDRQRPVDLIPTVAILQLFLARHDTLKAQEGENLVSRYLTTNRVELAKYLMDQGVLPSRMQSLVYELNFEKDRAALDLLAAKGILKNPACIRSLALAIYHLEEIEDPTGLTDSEYVVRRDHKKALWLIDQGFPLDNTWPQHTDVKNQTCALNHAITYGELEMVKMLIDKGASLTPQWKKAGPGKAAAAPEPTYVQPPLIVAARYGKVEIAKLLVEKGLNVNESLPKTGFTPLHAAALSKNRDMVEFLLAQGANPKAQAAPTKDIDLQLVKGTPAQMAASKGQAEIAQLLQAKE